MIHNLYVQPKLGQELDLVTRSRCGDRDAYARLIEIYRRPLFALLFSRVRNFDEARDLLHDLFVRGFFGIQRLQDPTRVGSWFYGIGLNLLRERRLRPNAPQALDAVPEPAIATAQEPSEREEKLQAAVRELPEELRDVLLLHHGEKMSYEEISVVLGIPWGTVQGRLARGRERLRQRLGISRNET